MIAFQAYRTTYFYEQREVPFQRFTDKTITQKISTALLGAKISKREMKDKPANPFEVVKLTDSKCWRVGMCQPKIRRER
jgi:uncharacterized protein